MLISTAWTAFKDFKPVKYFKHQWSKTTELKRTKQPTDYVGRQYSDGRNKQFRLDETMVEFILFLLYSPWKEL